MVRKYKYITFSDRKQIAAWYRAGERPADIADRLGVSTKTVYVGTPTAGAIGFYSWKAKAENVVKIKKANPEETEGIPVDLNNIQP